MKALKVVGGIILRWILVTTALFAAIALVLGYSYLSMLASGYLIDRFALPTDLFIFITAVFIILPVTFCLSLSIFKPIKES